MSKSGVFSGRYFPVFGLNTGKYGPEKTIELITINELYFKKRDTSHLIFHLYYRVIRDLLNT